MQKNHSFKSKALAVVMALALSHLSLVVVFAAPPTFATLFSRGNAPVKVNDMQSATGTTILSGAKIETLTGSGAIICITGVGEVALEGNSVAKLDFDNKGYGISLSGGCVSVTANSQVVGSISDSVSQTPYTIPAGNNYHRVCAGNTSSAGTALSPEAPQTTWTLTFEGTGVTVNTGHGFRAATSGTTLNPGAQISSGANSVRIESSGGCVVNISRNQVYTVPTVCPTLPPPPPPPAAGLGTGAVVAILGGIGAAVGAGIFFFGRRGDDPSPLRP